LPSRFKAASHAGPTRAATVCWSRQVRMGSCRVAGRRISVGVRGGNKPAGWLKTLDKSRHLEYKSPRSCSVRTWPGDRLGHWGECGACARACNPLPGGFGHQRSGTTAGVGVETLDWDRGPRVTPVEKVRDLRPGWRPKDRVLPPRPRKHGLELSWGVTTAQPEPPWNAERRARPQARPAPAGAGHTVASLGVPHPHIFVA